MAETPAIGHDEKASIEAAWLRERQEGFERAYRRTRHPWWHTFAQGRIYRPVMKLMHRWGWCYPQPSFPEGDVQWWCQWCGLRGRK
jgi:hypothetical protein